jgi:hypothetical protein
MNKWKPIETAPKDGTSVLVFPGIWNNKNISIAKFDNDKYARKPKPYWSRDDDMNRVTNSRNNPPTHWMPLPDPPTTDPS